MVSVKRLLLALVLTALGGTSAHAGPTTGIFNSQHGGGGSPSVAQCTKDPVGCGQFYGYSDIRWYGANCTGGGNDGPAIVSAINDAVSGGWRSVFIPHAVCNITQQIDMPTYGITFFSVPQHAMLDPTTVGGGELYFNTGYSGFSSANHCEINLNGHSINLDNINITGDGAQAGYAGICNSVTYTNSSLPLPEVNANNVSISRAGVGIGCAMPNVFVTPGSNPNGTCEGSLQGNLISIRGHHLILTQNGWGINANASDLFLDVLSQVAGNQCGGAYIASGSQDGNIFARFDPNGGGSTGTYAMCGGASWAGIDMNGGGFNIYSQFEAIQGPGIILEGQWSDIFIHGHFLDNGAGGTAGKDANIVFNGTAGGSFNANAIIDASFLTHGSPPKYAIELNGTADKSIKILGAIPTTSYVTAAVNPANESLPSESYILALGQAPTFNVGAFSDIITGSSTNSIVVDFKIASSAHVNGLTIGSLGDDIARKGWGCIGDVANNNSPFCWQNNGNTYVTSGGLIGWNNDSTNAWFGSMDVGFGRVGGGVAKVSDGSTGYGIILQSDSIQTPTTGFSITLGNTTETTYLTPAGTLATGTITMPASPQDKQKAFVGTSQTVSSLTVSPNSGQTIKGAPTTLTANTGFGYIYNSSNTTWYRLY